MIFIQNRIYLKRNKIININMSLGRPILFYYIYNDYFFNKFEESHIFFIDLNLIC